MSDELRDLIAGVLMPYVEHGCSCQMFGDKGHRDGRDRGGCASTQRARAASDALLPLIREREAAARAEGAAVRARVEVLVDLWESEGAHRGPDDVLYTAGVTGMLRDALDAGRGEGSGVAG